MKKINLNLILFVIISVFAISCGGKKEDEVKVGDYDLKVENAIQGPLKDFYSTAKATLKITKDGYMTSAYILVELEKNEKEIPKSYAWSMPEANILDASGIPLVTGADIYSYDDFAKLTQIGKGEKMWIKFSTYDDGVKKNPEKAISVQITSSLSESTSENKNTDAKSSTSVEVESSVSSSNNWDEIINNYEKFVNDYIKLYKKAQAGDITAMTEAASVMSEATELQSQLQGDLSNLTPAQAAKFAKLNTKLAQAALE